MATPAVRELPVGIPEIMISTRASRDRYWYIVGSSIMMTR